MKTLFPRLSRITVKDWLAYHPYEQEAPSDQFYLELCNDIQLEMLHIDVEDHLVGADYMYLSCMVICYLEDTVSHAGIWSAFINEHRRLNDRFLPFYDMENYRAGEINLADVQFLIWHFCSNLPIQSCFIDPFSIGNTGIAKLVYDFLLDASAKAPANPQLVSALTLAHNASRGKVMQLLDFFCYGNYLNRYYSTSLLQEEILRLKNRKGTQEDVFNRRLHLMFNRVNPLLAQRIGKTLACHVGESHPLYVSLLALSKRMEGYFLYNRATSSCLIMTHIASGTQIELMPPDQETTLWTPDETIVYMGIVQWDGRWYVSGSIAIPGAAFSRADIPENEKFLFAPIASHIGIIKRQEECFLEESEGSRLIFLRNKRDAFAFIDAVWDTFHHRFGAETTDRKLFDVHGVTFNIDDELENITIFFNPSVGLEFYPDVAHCISAPNNPFFDTNAEINIEELILNERISADFITYLVENRMIEIEPVSGSRGYNYVWTNCDFLLRYWKKEQYITDVKLFID